MKKFIFFILALLIFNGIVAQNRRTNANTTKPTKVADKGPINDKKSVTKETSNEADSSKKQKPLQDEGKSFLTPAQEMWKMSTVVELGAIPSDAAITTINIYGLIGFNFDINRIIHVGPYFKHTILSTHDYQVMDYQGVDYDASTLKDWGTGVSLGAYFPVGKSILIDPEVRIGYGEFTLQTPNFSATNNKFIYRNFLTLAPRINLGMKVSNYAILSVSGGYNLAYFLNDPNEVPHYNPSSFMYGLGIRFYLKH